MGKFAGGFLRILATSLYALAFCCAAVGLGVYSYFLAKLSIHHLPIDNDWRAVEGLTGAAVLYTIFAVILTCFLGGTAFFGLVGIVLNVLFCGAFIAVAILTRHGDSCSGIVNTPLGIGSGNVQSAGTHLGFACRLNSAAFATAIIAAFLFAILVFVQLLMVRNHRKEKKYGPSPANNYTSGYGRFFKRKPKTTKDAYGNGHDSELGTVGAGTNPSALNGRHSAETGYTGSTAMANDAYTTPATKYDAPAGGYHVGQTANPYSYTNNTHPTGTAVNY